MKLCGFSVRIMLGVLLWASTLAGAQAGTDTPAFNEISADLGNCSVELVVTSSDSKPVYAAKMAARVQYGVMGVKRLDLEAFTGSDGHVKITHLPDGRKKPIFIHITKGNLAETVEYLPTSSCRAHFDVQLH